MVLAPVVLPPVVDPPVVDPVVAEALGTQHPFMQVSIGRQLPQVGATNKLREKVE